MCTNISSHLYLYVSALLISASLAIPNSEYSHNIGLGTDRLRMDRSSGSPCFQRRAVETLHFSGQLTRRRNIYKVDGLRLRGGGLSSTFSGRTSPNFGTTQLPNFGSGPSLYLPLAGLACVAICGQLSSQVQKGTKGWSQEVRSRVQSTYAYFGASMLVWVSTAIFLWKAGIVPTPNSLFYIVDIIVSIFVLFKVSFISAHASEKKCVMSHAQVNTLDYATQGLAKSLYFLLFAGVQGASLAVILRMFASAQLLHLVV